MEPLVSLLVMLLFWPALAAAVGLWLAGLLLWRIPLLQWAALLTVPTALYLTGTPRFRYTAFLLPLLPLAAALALGRRAPWAAWLCLLPYAGFIGWLAVMAILH